MSMRSGLLILFVLLISASALAETEIDTKNETNTKADTKIDTKTESAFVKHKTNANPIHPVFPLLDSDGLNILESNKPFSTDKTCGTCHDVKFIDNHNSHTKEDTKATCIECHFEGGKLNHTETDFDEQGNLKRQAIRLHSPKPANCALCHGFVHNGQKPLVLPDDFEKSMVASNKHQRYDRSMLTGEILSDQNRSDSYLNLANKGSLTNPWDVHAGRMVTCSACHYTSNNPEKVDNKDHALTFLKSDPRRLSMADYLHQPDHNLKTSACTDCHNPMAVHKDLPYLERHMAKLDCLSCHAPLLMGPAVQSLDETVSKLNKTPLVAYRGMKDDANTVTTAYTKGYQPALLVTKTNSGDILAPYNMVTHYYWSMGKDKTPVNFDKVVGAFMSGKDYHKNYHSEVLSLFDANKDGQLSDIELRLDTAKKVSLIRKRLIGIGVADPTITGKVTPHRIHHGTMTDSWVSFDCAACHSDQSRIGKDFALATYQISGVTTEMNLDDDEHDPVLLGSIQPDDKNGLQMVANEQTSHYVLGHSKAPWSDSLGFMMFLMTAIGIGIHGGLRILSRKKRVQNHAPLKRTYMYSLYERIWHWLMALSIILLIITGIEIHWVGSLPLFGFVNAIWMHNLLALIMIVNAFLSLFYHLVSSDIKQFIPPRATFFEEVMAQAKYYLNGIFIGSPHPMQKTQERKLNPLQQITYMGLLNVILPFQVITGAIIWAAGWFPESVDGIGGLTLVTPLHNLGAWLLVTFILTHVYLTTTGHTVLSNVVAMVTGYEDIEAENTKNNEANYDK